jgi:branched-chain amino acid transport system substrate-binding protein
MHRIPGCRLAAAAILLCLPFLSAHARDLVVGQVVDYAGKDGEASRDYVAGAKTYFDSINSKGGVNGRKILHAVLDTGGAPGAMGLKLRELLDERHADVLFGFVGDDAVEEAVADPQWRDAGVAMVGPLAGLPAPAGAANRVFFTRPGYEAEVRQIVAHFRALQLTRFAIVKADNEQGRRVGEAVARELSRGGLQSAGSYKLPRAVTAADVQAVRALNAQALIVIADTVPAAEFIKRYRPGDAGANVVTLSTVNHRTMFELLGPKLAHGVMVTQVVPNPGVADSPLLKEHLDAIKLFRDEPPSHLTLEGFIAAKALVEGMKRAGAAPTRESILAAFQRIGRLDLKGIVVDLSPQGRGASTQVDIAMIRRNGALLQ